MFRIVLLTVLFVGIAHAEVYKYTNKQGKTSYSDIPIEGSEEITIPPVMTYKAPVIPKAGPQIIKQKLEQENERVPYKFLGITSPANQGTVRNNQGIVNVSYE